MKSKYFLTYSFIIALVLMQMTVYYPQKSFQQETPALFQQTMMTKDGCPVTHMYATKMYVPIMVKMFHDPTPNWQVTSVSLTNNTNSVVTSDGNDKYVFLISTNSTDQFNFRTVASYTDGVEHQVFIQFWSQNQQMGIDQFKTEKGYFCRDFQIDTSVAPPVPDYNKMIQEAQAGAFQNLISAVLEEHSSVDNLSIAQLVGMGISIFVLIIFLIFHRSTDSVTKKITNRVKHALETLQSMMGEIKMISQHMILSEKQSADKEKKRDDSMYKAITSLNTYVRNWQDQFVVAFRTMMLETGMVKQEKLQEFEKLTMMEPIKAEIINPVEEKIIDVTEIEKEMQEAEPVVEIKKKSTLKERILHKVKKKEISIMSMEEYKQFFLSKNLNKEQVLKLYKNLEPYVQKNYMQDINSLNKLNALYNIYQELDK